MGTAASCESQAKGLPGKKLDAKMKEMSKNITCKQAVDLISKKEEAKLSPTQRFSLYKHLGECSLCRIFSVQNKIIAKAIQHNNSENLSIAEKENIIQRVMKSGS